MNHISVIMVCHLYPLADDEAACGVSVGTQNLCRALQETGEVSLAVLRPLAPVPRPVTVTVNGVTVHALPRGATFPHAWTLLGRPVFQLRRALRCLNPDIVHVQDSAWIARWLPPPTLFTLRGMVERDMRFEPGKLAPRIKSRVLSITHGWARRGIGNFIAISPWAAAQMPPNPQRKTWQIPNPLSDACYQVDNRPVHGRILTACRVCRLKNIHGLIEAFALLAKSVPGAELRIAGGGHDPVYQQECLELSRTLGVAGRVHFLGWLGAEELRGELARASVFILPSFHENTPMSIAEAMAAGTPVAASRTGGVPWMLEDGRSGLLIEDPRDPGQIAAAALQALEPETARKLREAGKQRAEIFRAGRVAEQTLAVYREIVRTHRTAGAR